MLPNVNSGLSFTTVHVDQDGRHIIAKINIGDEQLFVVNIYAPNKGLEQELFISNLGAHLISKTDITKTIAHLHDDVMRALHSGSGSQTPGKFEQWRQTKRAKMSINRTTRGLFEQS